MPDDFRQTKIYILLDKKFDYADGNHNDNLDVARVYSDAVEDHSIDTDDVANDRDTDTDHNADRFVMVAKNSL